MLRLSLIVCAVAMAGAASAGSLGFVAPGAAGGATLKGMGVERTRIGSLRLRMQDGGEHKAGPVGRRAVLGALVLAAAGLPKIGAAETEAEQFQKLQAEAARLNALFESQRKANAGLPSLKENQQEAAAQAAAAAPPAKKATVASSVVKAPSPELKPEDVVTTLMQALKENDDKDTGLKKIVEFSSPSNPVKNAPFDMFVMQMKNSKYNLLLGNFDKFAIAKMEKQNDSTGQYTIVDVSVSAAYRTMLINGMDFDQLSTNKEGDSTVTFRWQLSFDPSSKCWLSDTVYIVAPDQTNA